MCVTWRAKRTALRLRRRACRDADFADSYRAVGITVLRRRNCQIFGPSRHLAKLSDSFCRYFDGRINLDRHLSRQATESYAKRSTALGLISHRALRTSNCGANLQSLNAAGHRAKKDPVRSEAVRRPLLGRTWARSHLCHKATLAILFDHLVSSSKNCGRYGEAERLRGLQIDDHQVFRRQLHRKLRRLCATENVIDVARTAVKYIFEVSSVGEQTAISGDNRCLVDRRNIISRCQRYDERAVDFDEIVGMPRRPLPGSRASAAMAASISVSLWTGAAIDATFSDRAAASNEGRAYDWIKGAVSGLNIITARFTLGAIAVSNSSHLLAIDPSIELNPVMFPPGAAGSLRIPSQPGRQRLQIQWGWSRSHA